MWNSECGNAWIAWIIHKRPGWILKTNSRICELHFVPEDYVYTRGNKSRKLKISASFINTASFQQAQDCSAIENTHKKEDLQQSVKYVEDIHNDIICIHNTIGDEYISCSTSPTAPSSPFPVVMSKITKSSIYCKRT
ncbi:uncharacterized protein LOC112590315 [Harpegnathos saltator]|uniref:uncharacterized protein LOC112590315 n=1 Tax=Harpegnathos saltator TaxID=610380 RepID=UPI000DBEEC73|nr:uncharacterized protein LOC112590315 [Harpegnathos saltator]